MKYRRRLGLAIVAGVIVAAVALLAVVFVAPLAHSFTIDTPAGQSCGAYAQVETYPNGGHLSGSWNAVSSAFPAEVMILGRGSAAALANGNSFPTVFYSQSGTSGSFSFDLVGSSYEFEVLPATQQHVGCPVPPAVIIQGSWTATLWQQYEAGQPTS